MDFGNAEFFRVAKRGIGFEGEQRSSNGITQRFLNLGILS